MWIELPNRTIEILNRIDNPMDTNITAINSLFDSMRRCQNIIFAEDQVLKFLEDHPLLSPTTRFFINWIRQKYIYIYEGYSSVQHKVIIDFEIPSVRREENNFLVPLSYFEEIGALKLLSENENDGDMFLNIFRHIAKKKKLSPYYFIRFENDAFHGGNAPTKIKQAAKDQQLILCIVDSDRDYPGGERGSTFKGARKAFNKVKYTHIIDFYELGVRERENLFPPYFYNLIISDSHKLFDILESYIDNESLIKYVDIKDGIKYKKIAKFGGENGNKKWDDFYRDFLEKCESESILLKPEDNTPCKDDFKCIKGIGPNLCDLLIDILIELDEDKFEQNFSKSEISRSKKDVIIDIRKDITAHIPTYLLNEWTNLYKLIFSWGCCLSKSALPIYTPD